MNGSLSKIFALPLLLPAVAWAYDYQRAQANLASDYAACAAFYMTTTEVLRNHSRDHSNAEAAAKNALKMAVDLSNQEVTSARVQMVTEMLIGDMKGDWSNWGGVVNKYGPPCRELTENPVSRLQYWLNKND